MTVGLIGHGRFGEFAAPWIARHSTVLVYDPRRSPPRRRGRILPSTLRAAASQEIVVLAVPVSSLRGILRSIAPYLRPGSLVVDVCSVKAGPVRWMKSLLPGSVHLLGTHPLFGPDSAASGLGGHMIVLCPVRIPARMLASARRLLRSHGLRTRVMKPAAHDRMMTETIFLTQYLGRIVSASGLRRWPVATPSYRHLMEIAAVAANDTPLLFRDMSVYNPFAIALRRKFRRAQARVDARLKNRQRGKARGH